MKRVVLAVIAIAGLASACTVRSERTVVEHPAAPSTAAVVVADPPPPAPDTVVVRHY
jgi:hypothetical protein